MVTTQVLTRVRMVVLAVGGILAVSTALVSVWSIGRFVASLLDPCVQWSAGRHFESSLHGTTPAGCTSVTVHGYSKSRAFAFAVLVPGGILLSLLIGMIGVVRSRKRLLWLATALMIAESFVAFSLFPLTLATGLALGLLAILDPAGMTAPNPIDYNE